MKLMSLSWDCDIFSINQTQGFAGDPKFGDTLSIKPDHSNVIYHIVSDSLFPAYMIDFGKFNIDKEFWDKSNENAITFERFEMFCNSKRYCDSFRYFESSTYLSLIYRQCGDIYIYIYSKMDNKGYNIYRSNFKNNIDMITEMNPITIDDNKLYSIIEPSSIFTKYKYYKAILPKKLIESINEYSNPIIVEMPIKTNI